MKILWFWVGLALPIQAIAVSIQGDASYFRPASSVLREVYGSVWIDYKVEMDQPLSYSNWFWERLSIFADASYLSKNGRTEGGHYRTRIQIIPISLGLKWVQPIYDSVNFYLGAAPRYFFLKIHDHLNVVQEKTHKNGLGGMAITGFIFDLWKGLYLDLFASYSFKHFDKPSIPRGVEGHSLEVGGLDAGGGIGWEF